MTAQDLKALLEAHVADVAERDFVDDAWTAAAGRQHRRRTILAGGLAAAVAAAVAVATVPALRGVDTAPATPTRSASATTTDPDVAFYGRDGTPYLFGGDQASLRDLQVATKIPPQDLRIPGTPQDLRALLAARTDASSLVVVAVGTTTAGGRDQPLLFVHDPAGAFAWVAVDLRLDPVDPVNGTSGVQPGAISPDGHTVVLVQPRELVVLDARTASVRRVPVDDPNVGDARLDAGGFSDDGSYVTWGSGVAFVLPPGGTRLVRAANEARPETWTIESETSGGETRAILVRRGKDHVRVGSRSVETHFDVYGPSAAGDGWVVRGGFPDTGSMPAGQERVSGLLAVTEDGSRRKVLVMDERADGDMKGGLTAVAFLDWTEHPTVLFRYRTPRGDSLGAWDLQDDTLSFSSRLDDPTSESGRPGVVTVSPRTSWTG